MGYVEKICGDNFSFYRRGKGLLLRVSIELTERCNNNCAHCYINLSPDDKEAKKKEITFAEIKRIGDEAVSMGCLYFRLTGGEPLLRDDFADIYLYLKRKGVKISLATNGTLIDAQLVSLFRKYPPGEVEVSIYGLNEKTYEAVTQKPGSFDAFMRGINLLKENGIFFTLKVACLPQNFSEIKEMRKFAQSLTGRKLATVVKLNLRARFNQSDRRRELIERRRLPSDKVMEVIKQDEEGYRKDMEGFLRKFLRVPQSDRLFSCGAGVDGCHIDAYNNFQLCLLLRHPDCVYNLREGSLKEAWEKFVPQVREMKVTNGKYRERCQRCFLKALCDQCPAWSWMEYGVLDEPVDYLCEIAHREAVFLGLLREGEKAWEVKDSEQRLSAVLHRWGNYPCNSQ